jgi:hypothetical protein
VGRRSYNHKRRLNQNLFEILETGNERETPKIAKVDDFH